MRMMSIGRMVGLRETDRMRTKNKNRDREKVGEDRERQRIIILFESFKILWLTRHGTIFFLNFPMK